MTVDADRNGNDTESPWATSSKTALTLSCVLAGTQTGAVDEHSVLKGAYTRLSRPLELYGRES